MRATFRYTLRRMRLSILGWGIGLAAIGALVVLGYETIAEKFELIEQLMKGLPPMFTAFAGDANQFATPTGWLHIKFFSILPVILGFFGVTAGAGLIVADEERGRLDLILAYPASRSAVFFGRLTAMMTATVLILVMCWLGLIAAVRHAPMELPLGRSLLPFVSLLAVMILFESLALLLSMMAPSRRIAAGLAGTIVVGSFFIEAFSQVTPWLQPVAPWLPLHYYQGGKAIDDFSGSYFTGLLVVAAAFMLTARWLFQRRDIRVLGEG
jgi:ABC-2 type transport system permease protein